MAAISKAGKNPHRLVHGEDRAGRLLRHADAAFLADLSTIRAWNRFQSERQKRMVVRFGTLAVALALCVSFARHEWLARAVHPPTLVAERVPAQPVLSPMTSSAVGRPLPPASLMIPKMIPKARAVMHTVASVAPPRVDGASDSTCRNLANEGQSQRAVECFQGLARESGVPAEVALYEAARLSADALHDSAAALRLLEEHQQRFPESALRVEVEWLRIRCLEHAGRLDEALSASEKLLDSAAGRPLAAKLHLLRGRIYGSDRNDCSHALPEYVALLGETGSAGADAELRRAECLEQLQRPSEARAAYQHYLERADAHDAERVRARLLALPTAAPSVKEQR